MNPNASGTEPQYAPAPRPSTPREMQLTPRGASTSPLTRHFPQVRAGVCEYCGVIDRNQPGQYQYKLCPHYRGMELRCVYCPDAKDQDEVVRNSILHVMEDPYNPGRLVIHCGHFECVKRFEQQFKRN